MTRRQAAIASHLTPDQLVAIERLAAKVADLMSSRTKLNVVVPSDDSAAALAEALRGRGFNAKPDSALVGTPQKLEVKPCVVVKRRRGRGAVRG